MDVKVSSKKESDRSSMTRTASTEAKKHAKQVEDEHKKKLDDLREQLTESLSNILLGEKIPLDVNGLETGEIIIPANRKITKTLLRKLASVYDRIEIDPSPIRNKINEIISAYKKRFDDLQMQHDEEMERVESGDDLETGIIKSVKVFIASKRKLSVGDKKWQDVTETKVLSPKSLPRKICPSWLMALRSISCSTHWVCLRV